MKVKGSMLMGTKAPSTNHRARTSVALVGSYCGLTDTYLSFTKW